MATYNKQWRMAKVDPGFADKIEKTAMERIKTGVDKKITKESTSIRRFTKAMTRYSPLWDILKKADFKEDGI